VRVALVYDRLNKVGGAEVILQAFHELFPQADWHVSVWDPVKAPFSASWNVHTSFIGHLPFFRHHHELIPFLMPFAFESFDLSAYDLVISVGSAEAKGVITRADTLHLNYCLTPTRYLYSHEKLYLNYPQFGTLQRLSTPLLRLIFKVLRRWDFVAAQRPDHMISISEHVKNRVKKYYKRNSPVIYPPVEINRFSSPSQHQPRIPTPYYLTVSRLVPYKQLDILLRAFKTTGRTLVVIGIGSELNRLKRQASPNIHFLGKVADSELAGYYQACRGFLQANTEDFGIAMVEALAAGKPVIAYQGGGAGEIVEDGVNGILVRHQTSSAFNRALDRFETMKFASSVCSQSAKRFALDRWQQEMQQYIDKVNNYVRN